MKIGNDADATALLENESSEGIPRFEDRIAGRVKPSFFQRIKTRLTHAFVQDLPADMLVCEYCDETKCTRERWETCPRRLDAVQGLPRD